MFKTFSECFTSRNVNVGMDEAHMLGLGKYLDQHGYHNRFEIMLAHIARINEIAKSYGFRIMMWSDMFFRLAFEGAYYAKDKQISKEILDKVPQDVKLIYWDYYSTDRQHYQDMLLSHKKFQNEIVFGGGAWVWNGFAPFNRFSIKATEAAFTECIREGINDVFITLWGDSGTECSVFSVLPTLVFAAEKAYGNASKKNIHQSFKCFGAIAYDEFMKLDELNPKALGGDELSNPCKYMLYNDLFLGMFDPNVTAGDGDVYIPIAKSLKKYEKNKLFGYIFKMHRLLAEVLSLKFDLGVLTREYYQDKNKEKLSLLITKRYKPLLKKLKEFHIAFSDYWCMDKKPHGFDVQDIRLGGLTKRVERCSDRLESYVAGKIDSIPELEEELLDIEGNGKNFNKKSISFNNYANNATPNIL